MATLAELIEKRIAEKAAIEKSAEEAKLNARIAQERRDTEEAEKRIEDIKKAVAGELESAIGPLFYIPILGKPPVGMARFSVKELDTEFEIRCYYDEGLKWTLVEKLRGEEGKSIRRANHFEGHGDSKRILTWVVDFVMLAIQFKDKFRE